jgi:CheY-like chemotaxis protein
MDSAQMLSEIQLLAKIPQEVPLYEVKRHDQSSDKEKHTVLVVDDEPLIADTLAEILNDSGFEAVAVYDGEAALEQAREWCPDAMITDVVMPGMNGIEVAKRVRQMCSHTRVFLLSGQAATTELVDRAKADGYLFELLAKPLHPEVLLKKLSQ